MKNLVISGLVGTSFLLSGFWFGLRLAPMPRKPVPAPAAIAAAAAKPPREAFSIETLRATSQNMLTVNQALQSRETTVAAREKKVQQQEEELVAERAALDRLHAHFKELYGEFQQRLQLVSDDESAQLQRQVEIFNSMDPSQSADLIRSLDDGTIVRLFSIMESKDLSKLVSAWKAKYPGDSTRLLTALSGMGKVVARDKIVLPISPLPGDAGTPAATPDATSGSPAPDTNAPAAGPNASPGSPSSPPPDVGTPQASSPDANSSAPTPTDSTSGTSGSAAPDASAPAASPDTGSGTSSSSANASASTPSDTSEASPDAAPAAPTPDAAPSSPAPRNASASAATSDSNAPLDTPGETAAKAAAASHNAPGSDETPTPSEFTPPTPTMRLAHEKPARFAAARTN